MISRKRLHIANQRARKIFEVWHFESPEKYIDDPENWNIDIKAVLGTYRKTRVFCSNPFCCGNPRNLKGKKEYTKQERKSLDNFKHQLMDIN